MLVFAVAGFLVQNLTRQGEKLLRAIRRSGSLIFVVFFANAGAHLDLATLASLWPVALMLVGRAGRRHLQRRPFSAAASPVIRPRCGAGAGRR